MLLLLGGDGASRAGIRILGWQLRWSWARFWSNWLAQLVWVTEDDMLLVEYGVGKLIDKDVLL